MNSSSSTMAFVPSFKRKRDSNSFDEPKCERPKNNVFMNYSFRDIGNSFISHLRGALRQNSFTILDHTTLPIGQDNCLELLKAIQESEIYILVFSINYTFSVRCLDELVYIMDCHHKLDQRKVVPIFYNVEPSHVRSQQGSFTEALEAHQRNVDPERVQKWKQALEDACQYSGLTLQNRDETKFVKKIVEELGKMLSPQELHVTDHPVGIKSRAEELISKLRLESKDVLVVGVFGISGIGKTTVVKETYNIIAAKFDVGCFIADIHCICGKRNWKVKLQKELISCLTRNDKHPIIDSHNEGVTKIRKLISRQKVLLVLDDVVNFQQLEVLGIYPEWFYSGSRIIVTTRDKQSLGYILHASYHTMLMNRRESLNLFTRLMFGRDDPVKTKFVEDVVCHAGGLPLVLKVWSRHFKHHEREQWPSVLETLKRIPHGDIQKQLQMSYDTLDNKGKKLLLDIVCFFDGMEKDLVIKVLKDEPSAFFPHNEIQYLVDKFLVEITGSESLLSMHHAIREMAREIVRQENEDEPGKRTRVWDETDAMCLLTKCSGTEVVESIRLRSFRKEEIVVQIEAFKKMSNLRLIQLYQKIHFLDSSLDVAPSLSFEKLKYMEWHGFPFKRINIDMCNVVVLRLTDSKLEILWEGIKSLKKLRILDVRMSRFLTKTGDFYGLENLEELYFIDCVNLKELHTSIRCLQKLANLDLHSLMPLKKIPWQMIGKLRSLRQLKLGRTSDDVSEELIDPFSSSVQEFPCILQLHELKRIELVDYASIRSIPNLPHNITYIKAYGCANLLNLPSNMSELKSLTVLDFHLCPELGSGDPQILMKVTGLTNLSHLSMSGCNVSQVPYEIGKLVSLKKLDLSINPFSNLPDLSNLSVLVDLNLDYCSHLRLLPLLPVNLKNIGTYECRSLDVKSSASLHMNVCKESPFSKGLVIRRSGDWFPDWCSCRSKGDILSFVAPMDSDKKICGMFLCATITRNSVLHTISFKMINKTKNTSHRLKKMELDFDCSMRVLFYPLDDTTLAVEAGDTVVLEFPHKSVSNDGLRVCCGLRLIYESDVVDYKLVTQNSSSHRRSPLVLIN